jgi:hypothetical protein
MHCQQLDMGAGVHQQRHGKQLAQGLVLVECKDQNASHMLVQPECIAHVRQ